jgi:hypothetical protein
MGDKQRQEQIKLETEVLKLLGFALVALVGGTASVSLIRPPTTYLFLLTVVGAASTVLVGLAAVFQYDRIKQLIKQLEE